MSNKKKVRYGDPDDALREASSRKVLHKLEARARLIALGEEASRVELTVAQLELLRMRAYLLEWKAHQEAYRPRLGAPDSANFLSGADSGVSTASEWLERSDKWAMGVITMALEQDLRKRPDGEAMRAALLVRLMNISIPAKVFRHGRLLQLSPAEVEQMADRAELELVVIVKVYGLPLHAA